MDPIPVIASVITITRAATTVAQDLDKLRALPDIPVEVIALADEASG